MVLTAAAAMFCIALCIAFIVCSCKKSANQHSHHHHGARGESEGGAPVEGGEGMTTDPRLRQSREVTHQHYEELQEPQCFKTIIYVGGAE